MIRRHSLVWLNVPPISDHSSHSVEAWFESGHPFMVCRTRLGEELSLGFCLPRTGDDPRSPARIGVSSRSAHIQHIARPPEVIAAEPTQPAQAARPLRLSDGSLPHLPVHPWLPPPPTCTARVIGSHMWQFLTGEPYTCASSDMDLVLDIPHAGLLDEAAAFLHTAQELSAWKLDAELSIPNLGEVHWREWLSPAELVLIKSLDAVELHHRQWFQPGSCP